MVILPTEIVKKELLLVIPNAEQSEQTKRELQEATQWARAHSIVFTIQKL